MNKNKKIYLSLTIATILMLIALVVGALIWEKLNVWIPFAIIFPITIIVFIFTIIIYMKSVKFICPKCNQKFKPSNSAIIWAIHTPTKRKHKCPHCNTKSWCKEDFE